ncbi:hypothetical protein OS493_021022 [Desmophyllum pertusum]|uniref:Uncharacterized protein n=1 Tax=Desmophyllum pertusum TaxID=174260 RepID=A0A9X0D880_9CNID|nr:hypothetical protein OS493_021022 [Desmophyllum pertusum]
MSSGQIRPPPSTCRDPLSTPLRELPVNKQNVLKDQLPSVLSHSNLSKGKSNSNKNSKNMMPKRVCSATKENVQSLSGPSRSASVLELNKFHSKKVKKHVNGLRRAMSNSSIGTSRNFAPRTSPKRGDPAHPRLSTDQPRWQ